CVANMSRRAQAVELDLQEFNTRVPVEMTGGSAFPPIGALPYLLTLPPYGFVWFLLASETEMPAWHVVAPEPMPEFVTLITKRGLDEILQPASRQLLEREALPKWLAKRRWFGAKQASIEQVRLVYAAPLPVQGQDILLSEIEVRHSAGSERYQLPLAFSGDDGPVLAQQLALARVRRGREVGLLTDAVVLDDFARALLRGMRAGLRLEAGEAELRFRGTALLAALDLPDEVEVSQQALEQSNTSIVIGRQV